MTWVVAGIIQREEKVLIGQRRPDQPHPMKWEFPGGKVENGESPQDALARELEEELGIRAVLGNELIRYEFSYPGKKPILLIFIQISEYRGIVQNRIFEQIQWADRAELRTFDFLEGDDQFLEWFTGHH